VISTDAVTCTVKFLSRYETLLWAETLNVAYRIAAVLAVEVSSNLIASGHRVNFYEKAKL